MFYTGLTRPPTRDLHARTMVSAVTSQHELFCLAFVRTRSKTQAFIEAYDPPEDHSPARINTDASRIFNSPIVKRRISQLIGKAAKDTLFTAREALVRWLSIAMADPNELVSLRIGACRYCHGENHGYHWRKREYLEALTKAERDRKDFPNWDGGWGYDATAEPHPACPECHGEGVPRQVIKDTENLSAEGMLLFAGVKQTNQGLQVLMADRQKALDNACRLIGAYNDKVEITGELRKMQTVISLETKDPVAASKAYLDMISLTAPS